MIFKRKTATVPQPTTRVIRYALPAWSFRLSRQPDRAA